MIDLSKLNVIHVACAGKLFTQFRMPLIRKHKNIFRRLLIYCPYDKQHIRILMSEGFEVYNASVTNKPTFKFIFDVFLLYYYLLKNRFDVMIAHQPMGALIGILAAHLAKVPVKIYSTGGLKHIPGINILSNQLLRWGEYELMKLCSGVLLVNREDENALKNVSFLQDKVFCVGPRGGCGIDLFEFNVTYRLQNRDVVRKTLGVNKQVTLIGYAGRCVWEKGFREMIDCVEHLNNYYGIFNILFIIIGEGQDYKAIEQYATKRHVGKYFRFMGYQFQPKRLMSAFDIFVLPSYREGFPVALLEAASLGIPCIATDVRGSRELIKNDHTGLLIPPKNHEALARAIAQLIKRDDRGQSMGIRAADFVEKNYGEKVLLKHTTDTINQIIRNVLHPCSNKVQSQES